MIRRRLAPLMTFSVILLGAACGSTSDAPSSDAGAPDAAPRTDSASPAPDGSVTEVPDAATPDAVADADASVGKCSGGAVCPPNLDSLVAAHPGLTLGWNDVQPCDSVEIEFETMLIPYPSQATPVGPPNFTVTGATATSYTDVGASDTNTSYTFHARCVVGGVRSDWSNELAHAGST